jgi:DNA-binding transcriptional ArsR family regulator
MTAERGEAEEVLLALAEPIRRWILDVLAADGVGTATSIAARTPVSRQAIAKHLAVLGRAGLVEGVRCGREVQYRVSLRPLADASRWMAGLATRWDRRLREIKWLAEVSPWADPPQWPTGRAQGCVQGSVKGRAVAGARGEAEALGGAWARGSAGHRGGPEPARCACLLSADAAPGGAAPGGQAPGAPPGRQHGAPDLPDPPDLREDTT